MFAQRYQTLQTDTLHMANRKYRALWHNQSLLFGPDTFVPALREAIVGTGVVITAPKAVPGLQRLTGAHDCDTFLKVAFAGEKPMFWPLTGSKRLSPDEVS